MQDENKDAWIANLLHRIERLEQRFTAFEERDRIFEKAFRVIGLHTNYAEFGAYKGHSMISAYYSAKKICDELLGGDWNHAFTNPDETASVVINHWKQMRFFAFDSFQGMPATSGPDKEMEIFKEGTYRCGSEEFFCNIRKYGVPENKVVAFPGFFSQSCTAQNVSPHNFGNVGILHIDCDLYESAKTALDFMTSYCVVTPSSYSTSGISFLATPTTANKEPSQNGVPPILSGPLPSFKRGRPSACRLSSPSVNSSR
ncbi:MAG: TylF/MycF family methyltransferase [Verrucomicrobia bacterium]|nr:TylF/MycF family methyltransferase [Verrucomicrobiota bacterium]